MNTLDVNALDKLKVEDLKKELVARGQKPTAAAKKGDLVAQLKALLEEEIRASAAAAAAATAAAIHHDRILLYYKNVARSKRIEGRYGHVS